jgi:CxxC motif-containing protein (DUF1111 family)
VPDIKEGKQIFTNINCGKCHLPEMQTGNFPIDAYPVKHFFPIATFCCMIWDQA